MSTQTKSVERSFDEVTNLQSQVEVSYRYTMHSVSLNEDVPQTLLDAIRNTDGKKAIITVAPSSAGKSTLATLLQQHMGTSIEEVNRDTVRFDEFCNGEQDWSLYQFSRENEDKVTELCDMDTERIANSGSHLIVSDTNVNHIRLTKLIAKVRTLGFVPIIVCIYCDIDTLMERNANRGKLAIPNDVLVKQYNSFIEIRADILDTCH